MYFRPFYMGVKMTPICVYKQVCSTPKLNGENVSAPNRHVLFFWFGSGRSAFVRGGVGGMQFTSSFAGNVMFKKSFTNDPNFFIYTPEV